MRQPTVAIIAPGEMGSAIGKALSDHGVRVLTSVSGRSENSIERARRAGFETTLDDAWLVSQSEFILSVVPPAMAPELAKRFAPVLAASVSKPVYVDCNAISPRTAGEIGNILGHSGCDYVDACLFGGPTSGKPGVVIYASGEAAPKVNVLHSFGIQIRVIDGPIGAASAMKLSFAGLNKGFTALGATMVMAAIHAGSDRELAEQLANSQPGILTYISRFVPAMYPKAYRWDEEMLEIADFLADDEDGAIVYRALSRIYRRLAEKIRNDDPEMSSLKEFCLGLQKTP
jgi:L-threonate 2-dehydrogenase